MQHIYVSKSDIKIICSRETIYGFYLLEEPYKIVPIDEKLKLSKYVDEFMTVLKNMPKSKERTSNLPDDVFREKNFKKFSKKHLCIIVKLVENKYKVCNWCRMPDGSYGKEKGRWEEYMEEYECPSTDMESLDKNIVKAIEDGEAYLNAIGSYL